MPSLRRNYLGYYFLDLTLDGKRTRKSLDTKVQSVARLRAKTILAQGNTFPERKSLAEFSTIYKEWIRPRISHGHFQNITTTFKHLEEAFPDKFLDQVTLKDAELFIANLLKKKLTPWGANFYLRNCRAIWGVARTWKLVQENPFEQIRSIRLPQVTPRAFRPDELKQLLATTRKEYPELLDLFSFYVLTGLRRNEALSLSWDNVNFDQASLMIFGKGSKYRIVPLLPMAKAILQSRTNLSRPFDFVGSTITHKFQKVVVKAELSGFKLHDLRKTFSTLLADQGVSDYFIQNWMGHSSGQVTRAHYIGRHDDATDKKLAQVEEKLRLNCALDCL